MRIIRRYLWGMYLKPLGLCALVFVGIYIFIDMINLLDDIDEYALKKNITGWGVAWLTLKLYLTKAPQIVAVLSPFIALMAASWALALLLRHNEHVALLSAGVSMQRVIAMLVFFAFLVGALNLANREFLLTYIRSENLGDRLLKNREMKHAHLRGLKLPPLETDGYRQTIEIGSFYFKDHPDGNKKNSFSDTLVRRAALNGLWKFDISKAGGVWIEERKCFLLYSGNAKYYADAPGQGNINIFQLRDEDNQAVLSMQVAPGQGAKMPERPIENFSTEQRIAESSDEFPWTIKIFAKRASRKRATAANTENTLLLDDAKVLISSRDISYCQVTAKHAEFIHTSRLSWKFYSPEISFIYDGKLIRMPVTEVRSPDSPSEVFLTKNDPPAMSFHQLVTVAKTAREAYATDDIELEIWDRLAEIPLHIILTLLGTSLLLLIGSRHILVGVSSSFGLCVLFYLLVFIMRSWGQNGQLSPFSAVFVPLIFFGLLGMALFYKVRS